jgi:hypothetical protein
MRREGAQKLSIQAADGAIQVELLNHVLPKEELVEYCRRNLTAERTRNKVLL